MNIQFNGDVLEWDHAQDLAALIRLQCEHLFIPYEQVVVAVNQQFIPRSEHENYFLEDGDSVEMLTAIVGG